MKWDITIGLETHIRLLTNSKIFSNTPNNIATIPNIHINHIDAGLPGALPMVNKKAIEYALLFGLAIGARIPNITAFARKNYFYPDLPKGYQISQFDLPIATNGKISYFCKDIEKFVKITRAHLEEDAGKSIHSEFTMSNGCQATGIDLNRAGSSLLEIVTEPELNSAYDAVSYAKSLHKLVIWLNICDGNMQDGSFRCDANVSVKKHGSVNLGTRTEIKNLNSFKFLEQAINFEANRQIDVLENGGVIKQETRLYDPEKNITVCMREKENSQDYRYFNDPDIPLLNISEEIINTVKEKIPELPNVRFKRFQDDFSISMVDSAKLIANRATSDYFDAVAKKLSSNSQYKEASNLILGDLTALSNKYGKDITLSNVTPQHLVDIIKYLENDTISHRIAKEIISGIWEGKLIGDISHIIESENLIQIDDTYEITNLIDETIIKNLEIVKEFLSGKEKAINSLVGLVMKNTKGKANPKKVLSLIIDKVKKYHK